MRTPGKRFGWFAGPVGVVAAVAMLAANVLAAGATAGAKTAPDEARQRVTKDEADKPAPAPMPPKDVNAPEIKMDDALWQPAPGSGGNVGDRKTGSGGLTMGAAMTRQDRAIEQILDFYLRMYDKHLQYNNWIVRAFAVVSLARIQDPRVTERLFHVMLTGRYIPRPAPTKVVSADATAVARSGTGVIPLPPARQPVSMRRGDIMVCVFAWEALAARYHTLPAEYQKVWREQAVSMCKKGWLAGDLRVNVIRLMESEGPTKQNLDLFSHLFGATNSLDPYDIHTLEAMRSCVTSWKHPGLIKALISAMGKLDDFYRAEFLLSDLGAGVPYCTQLKDKGSRVMQRATQEAWFKWLQETTIEPTKTQDLRKFSINFALLPAGETIRDPKDPQWRRDLELEKFRLDPIDVAFVVDSTGSMGHVVRWVQSDVMKMMRAFDLISTEPRIGVTFYRDHGDEYVTQVYPMTSSAAHLAKSIQTATAKGGADLPEAVLEALQETVNKIGWSKSGNKAVVLIGDAPPHEDTLPKVQALVEQCAKAGAKFYGVKVRTPKGADELPSFDDIAKWGNGKSMEATFSGNPGPASTDIARAIDKESPDQIIFSEVLKGCLAQGYHDRIEPFVAVLCQYVQMPLKENREHFDPYKPPPPRTERREPGGHGNERPKDPRAQ